MVRHIETEKRAEPINTTDVLVLGNGEIGEKARQLIDKTPILRALGFHTPNRTVLAEDFFDDFFKRNGLGANLKDASNNHITEADIRRGSLTKEQFEILQILCHHHHHQKFPLVIRSSAVGDARGTGIYESAFTTNHIGSIRKVLQKVLASYFSPNAVAFRRDATINEGFGIIIEPMIGQEFDGLFTPILSGFGYTSTSKDDGYISAVPGLGCGVKSRTNEQINKSEFKKAGGSLENYIFFKRNEMFNGFSGYQTPRRSALLKTDRRMFSGSHYWGQAFFMGDKYNKAKVGNHYLDYPNDIEEILNSLDLMPFFQSMEQLEQILGQPQYFEWAMTIEGGQPIFWIIQIVNIDKKLDLMDFSNLDKTIFTGHTVTGTGVKEATQIVICQNPEDIKSLHKFNQKNKNYVLIFYSRLVSNYGPRQKLNYSDYNNAAVFLEIQDVMHTENPVSHLGGPLDMTQKFFAVLDYDAEVPPDWDLFYKGTKKINGLRVFNGQIKVIASEKQNKLILGVG